MIAKPDGEPASTSSGFARSRRLIAKPNGEPASTSPGFAPMSDDQRYWLRVAMPWLAMAFFLIVWELACIVFDVPEILLPKPTRIFAVAVQRWDILLQFCLETMWTTMIGFLLAIGFGLLLGLAIGASPFHIGAAGILPLGCVCGNFRRSS